MLREATAIDSPLALALNHGTASKSEEAGGMKSGTRDSTLDSSYGLNASPGAMARGGKTTSNKRLAPSCLVPSCNDEASFPKLSCCRMRVIIAGTHMDDCSWADAAWSCDSHPSCKSTSASATSCIIAKGSVSVTLCIALLHVLSGPRDATAAAATGTTTSHGEVGVVEKNQMM
jgi:hypothetical protein